MDRGRSIRGLCRRSVFLVLLVSLLSAGVGPLAAKIEMGKGIFHSFIIEADIGYTPGGVFTQWDLDGWLGGDYHRLWLKSEGELVNEKVEEFELWAMYGYNLATYWDIQIGLRYDPYPQSLGYAVLGIETLAPYSIETEAYLFVSHEGHVSLRARAETEFLFTQRLVVEPYLEFNIFFQDAPKERAGAGLASAEIGLQIRYEIIREFAPYLDFRYEQKSGRTYSIAKNDGEAGYDYSISLGSRFLF